MADSTVPSLIIQCESAEARLLAAILLEYRAERDRAIELLRRVQVGLYPDPSFEIDRFLAEVDP